MVACAQSLVLLASVGLSRFHLSPTAAASFEVRAGNALFRPAVASLIITIAAGLMVLAAFRWRRSVFAALSLFVSASALVLAFGAQGEHQRALDPRPELDRELAALDFGAGTTVELRTGASLPDFPNARWTFRVPATQPDICGQIRGVFEDWADPGSVEPRQGDPCLLDGRRDGGHATAHIARVPSSAGAGGLGSAYVLIQLSPCINDPCG